jgi:hypothetical protein
MYIIIKYVLIYRSSIFHYHNNLLNYRKPPTISPGLIYFRKRFLMGLYKGGLIYGGGLIHGRSFVLVINKSDINKSGLIVGGLR